MKKVYLFLVLFGVLVIFGGTLFVKMIVDYYSETWNIYALGSVAMVVYAVGITVGIVCDSLFKEAVFWIKEDKNED